MKPVIGITTTPSTDTLGHGVFDRFVIASNYVDAVLAAGGLPILLPPQDGHSEAILSLVDGLIFSGGADLDPSLYGDSTIHPKTYGVNPRRDRFELDLLPSAIERDTPLLCICRGIQVLNVAFGGGLIQDVPDQYSRNLVHRQQEAGIDSASVGHVVAIETSSPLHGVFGGTTLGVNSFHHQAIRDLGSGLLVDARAPDGLIEAVSIPGQVFAIGVQWHPELMFTRHPEQLLLFASLVAAASARKLACSSSKPLIAVSD